MFTIRVWHKMKNSNLLELLPWSCPDAFVMEDIALMKSTHLQLGRTLPLVVVMKHAESDGIFITNHINFIVLILVVLVVLVLEVNDN
jgi:hypothetical protein